MLARKFTVDLEPKAQDDARPQPTLAGADAMPVPSPTLQMQARLAAELGAVAEDGTRWSPRRAGATIVGASLVLWGGIAFVGYLIVSAVAS